MSLIGFHRFLIAMAILFCAGFAAWTFLDWLEAGDVGSLLLAIAFAAAAAALGYYLSRLTRILGLRDGDE